MSVCETCNKHGDRLCSRCRSVFYCSTECQKVGWSEHKKICVYKEKPAKDHFFKNITDEMDAVVAGSSDTTGAVNDIHNERVARINEKFSHQDQEISKYVKEHIVSRWKHGFLNLLKTEQIDKFGIGYLKELRKMDKERYEQRMSINQEKIARIPVEEMCQEFIISDVSGDKRFKDLLEGRKKKFITIHIGYINIYSGTLYFRYSFSKKGIINAVSFGSETFGWFTEKELLIPIGSRRSSRTYCCNRRQEHQTYRS
jgi:hypothetical protein